jgi:hypothetical protein
MHTLEEVEPTELALLRERYGWTARDFDALAGRLGESFHGGEGYASSIGGRHVDLVPAEEGDGTEYAIASLERNSLLADLLERGEIDRVVAYLREWPQFSFEVRSSDAR